MRLARQSTTALALGVAAVILAVVALALHLWGKSRQREGERKAAAASAAVGDGLRALSRAVGERALAARRVPVLRAALDREVDAVTLGDLLATEDGWAPFRSLLTVVARGGQPLARLGAGADALAAPAVLAGAGSPRGHPGMGRPLHR